MLDDSSSGDDIAPLVTLQRSFSKWLLHSIAVKVSYSEQVSFLVMLLRYYRKLVVNVMQKHSVVTTTSTSTSIRTYTIESALTRLQTIAPEIPTPSSQIEHAPVVVSTTSPSPSRRDRSTQSVATAPSVMPSLSRDSSSVRSTRQIATALEVIQGACRAHLLQRFYSRWERGIEIKRLNTYHRYRRLAVTMQWLRHTQLMRKYFVRLQFNVEVKQ
eukprot:PhF_6_TR6094/c0_g1_i1/m.8940